MACFGFFIPFSARCWCVAAPAGAQTGNNSLGDPGLFKVSSLSETVFEHEFESGLTVRVSRDGLIMLRLSGLDGFLEDAREPRNPVDQNALFGEEVNFRMPYVEAMNAYLACLGGALASHDVALKLEHVALNQLTEGGSDMSVATGRGRKIMPHLDARQEGMYIFPPHADERNFRTEIISESTLTITAENLNKLVTMPKKEGLKLASMFTMAISSLQEHDFSRSLITSWAIIETIIGFLWIDLMAANIPPITGARKKRWKGNNFTASIKTEMLSVAGLLSQREYKLIDAARVSRNDWIHALDDVNYISAINAAYTASILFERIYQIPLAKRYPVWI